MANITHRSPGADFRTLQQQMTRLFEPFVGRTIEDEELMRGTWAPPVDVVEEQDAIVVSAELPGMKREDIEIQYENGLLTLRGQRHLEREQSEKTFHRVERAYGTFVRTFTLPRGADSERISASYENGVLEIRVPKREEAKARSIQINVK